MAMQCPYCGRQYDIALFQFGRSVTCVCGNVIEASHVSLFREVEEIFETVEDKRKADELRKMADRVCRMILDPRIPDVDIEIAKNKVRRICEELFPDKLRLFEMVYESRFQRLWKQFRSSR
jgi:hypothetical protein